MCEGKLCKWCNHPERCVEGFSWTGSRGHQEEESGVQRRASTRESNEGTLRAQDGKCDNINAWGDTPLA